MLSLIIPLLLAHVVGDFLIQPKSWVKDKEDKGFRSIYLILHSIIHFLLVAILFLDPRAYWLFWVVIPVSHYLIDGMKSTLNNGKNSVAIFAIDQLLHFAVIAFLAYHVGGFTAPEDIQFPPVLIGALALSLSILTFVSSVLIKVVLGKWSNDLAEDSRSSVSLQASPGSDADEEASLAKAGMYIGILERLLVFLFIVFSQWAAIGFLITAKSVFRFSDLSTARNRKLTEYMLLGSLLSFTIAIITGLFFLNVSIYVNSGM
ncbi:MAG: DUF3307 domain-containing protein [Flavobacteriia bacterium]|nr:DUF3307 domain-containing protein [Flavobacteriia bacterium]